MGDLATQPIRLELTLELRSADPPCGRLLTAAGGELPFAGWLGFALALERVIEGTIGSRQVVRGGPK